MFEELLKLLGTRSHSGILVRRRASVVVDRVRGFSWLFAALTLAWIPIDAAVFGPSHWHGLAAARVLAAAALALLALSCRSPNATPRQAAGRVLALYAIPIVFFAMTLEIFVGMPREGVAAGVAVAYSFMPLMLAAGISAFPLTAPECLALAAMALLAQCLALWTRGRPLLFQEGLEGFWLLLLIAGVASFAALSQMRMLVALMRQAARDPLTGCYRREIGQELLDMHFLLAARQGAPLAVLFTDIDHFKAVNDAFGHGTGDRVLAEVARSLRTGLRDADLLVRWGGEEFVVLLPLADRGEAVRLVERLRSRGFATTPDGRAVTLSIGIAECRADEVTDAANLVALADRRMYAAKQAGRDRYVSCEDGVRCRIPTGGNA